MALALLCGPKWLTHHASLLNTFGVCPRTFCILSSALVSHPLGVVSIYVVLFWHSRQTDRPWRLKYREGILGLTGCSTVRSTAGFSTPRPRFGCGTDHLCRMHCWPSSTFNNPPAPAAATPSSSTPGVHLRSSCQCSKAAAPPASTSVLRQLGTAVHLSGRPCQHPWSS